MSVKPGYAQGDPSSYQATRYDVYSCDGLEKYFFTDRSQPLPPSTEYQALYGPMSEFLTFEETFYGPPYGVDADNDPVGHAHESFLQYRDTATTFNSQTKRCDGEYDPSEPQPDFRGRITRDPIARAYSAAAEAAWNATRAQDSGNVNLTWGHVNTRYDYRFKIEAIGAGCGAPGGCGINVIGLAWSLIPEEKQKTDQTVWGYNWCYSGQTEC